MKAHLLSRRDSINQGSRVITFISQSARGSASLRAGVLPTAPFASRRPGVLLPLTVWLSDPRHSKVDKNDKRSVERAPRRGAGVCVGC